MRQDTGNRYWYRRTAALAAPIIVSNLSVPLVGAVDTAVVGHLPDPVYVGAVALGAVVFSFLFWGFGFLRMGTTGFVAQASGRRDTAEVRAVLARALLTGAALGLALVVLQWPISLAVAALIEAQGELQAQTLAYFEVRIWGAPATLVNYALLGCMIGLQRTGAALVHQLALNLTNAGLDLLLVMGLGQGVAGVAAASVAAELVAVAVGLRLIAVPLPQPLRVERARLLDRQQLRALVQVNANIAIRTLCLITGFAYFTLMGSRQGEAVLAANAVLLHFQHFLAYGLDGFAHAAESLAGHAYGSRRRADFDAAVRASTVLAVAVAVAFTACYLLVGELLVGLLTSIEEVRALAGAYLPWVIASPLLSVWSFQLDGIFIGTTRTREMRNAMLVSLALFAGASVPLMQSFGNHGLWAALLVFMLVRALTLALYFPRLRRACDP